MTTPLRPASPAAEGRRGRVRGLRLFGGGSPVEATVEQLLLVAALFWALSANQRFFAAALQGRAWGEAASWGFAAALGVALVALHVLLLALVANRWTVKPLLALLLVAAALGQYYMGAYGVYMDPTMLRNVLRTHPAEASELITGPMLLHLALYAGLPIALLWRVKVVQRPWVRAALVRGGLMVLAAVALVGAVISVYQPLASLMRNQREVRYLITPANLLWSSASVLAADARGAAKPREPIGLDAAPGPSWAARQKPLVVVMVVGETARAANWGLSGAPRATTPQLAKLPVLNFPQVSACGTNTETSLPCMFAPIGRRDYDEARIRGQESILHVAARAGVAVHWRDNQSGCKGVCEGLPNDLVNVQNAPGLCPDGRCLDEGLVHDLDRRLAQAQGTQLWVLHMMGSHGPSYYRRYPAAFARFQPDCRQDDLRRCSIPEVVNAYDNSLLYTDHVLATAIAKLQANAQRVDSALVYVSDHGESLGEHGLFLHGVPYAIAPEVQTRVPMVMWFSTGLEQAAGLKPGCLAPALQQQAGKLLAHDHVAHTLLGLLDVRSTVREPTLDLTQPCRAGGAGAGATP